MKVSAFVPYWLDYQVDERGHHKNLKKLGGKYLINYSIALLNSIVQIDETVIYSSDKKIEKYLEHDLDYKYLSREKYLDDKNISIDEIIEAYLDVTDADIIILLHPNSPFLSKNTLESCLSKVLSGEYDSSFTAYEFKKLTWFKNKPLNYSLDKKTPKLETLDSVVIEQSSLYIFAREAFYVNKKRVGNNPYVKYINHFEGLEVESQEDFEIAELIVNSGMYPKV